jgi:hypothetical protein
MSEPTEPSDLPAIAGEPLSVILLAYQSAAWLPEVLGGWVAELTALRRDHEIILVDDGSTDSTPGLATFLAGRLPRTRVLCHADHRGLGAALRTGLAAARYPLVFYTTCDRQYQPADFQRLLRRIDQVHVVSGFRLFAPVPLWLRGLGLLHRGLLRVVCGQGPERLPGWLGWSGHLRRFLARMFFGVRFQDVDCAFRLFRRSIFARIPIQSDGPFAQVETLAKANFLGCLMAEEPVPHRPPRAGEPCETQAPWRQTLREAWRLLSRARFGPAILPEPAPLPCAPTVSADSSFREPINRDSRITEEISPPASPPPAGP